MVFQAWVWFFMGLSRGEEVVGGEQGLEVELCVPVPVMCCQGAHAPGSALAAFNPVDQDAADQHVQIGPELRLHGIEWVRALQSACEHEDQLLDRILDFVPARPEQGAEVHEGFGDDLVGTLDQPSLGRR